MIELATEFLVPIGMGALFAWSACLLVGCRLLAPDFAIAIGLLGLWLGWEAFRKLGLPLGPSVAGVDVIPGFLGTFVVLLVYVLFHALRDWRERAETPPPRPLDREVPRFVRPDV